jgi:hypothetical protein
MAASKENPATLSELCRETDLLKDEQRKRNEWREARGELVLRDDIERRFWCDAYAAWVPSMPGHTEAAQAADLAVRELRSRQ